MYLIISQSVPSGPRLVTKIHFFFLGSFAVKMWPCDWVLPKRSGNGLYHFWAKAFKKQGCPAWGFTGSLGRRMIRPEGVGRPKEGRSIAS